MKKTLKGFAIGVILGLGLGLFGACRMVHAATNDTLGAQSIPSTTEVCANVGGSARLIWELKHRGWSEHDLELELRKNMPAYGFKSLHWMLDQVYNNSYKSRDDAQAMTVVNCHALMLKDRPFDY